MKNLFLMMAAAAALCAAAVEYNSDTILTEDVLVDGELKFSSPADTPCVFDLAGHNLTLNGKLSYANKTIITNSAETLSEVKFYLGANGVNSQFQNLVFGGNLRLTVGGTASSNAGFQGANNTHTGGFVLDGFNKGRDTARFTTNKSFGTGDIILKNGSRIYLAYQNGNRHVHAWRHE